MSGLEPAQPLSFLAARRQEPIDSVHKPFQPSLKEDKGNEKRRLIPVLCAAAVAVSLAGCSGSSGSATEKGADTQTPKAEAGAETGKEEDGGEKKEEAGGSKDEKLIIYSPLTESMIDSMLAMFEEDTGIDAECLAMGTGDALKRIQTEADNPQADILWSGTIGTVKTRASILRITPHPTRMRSMMNTRTQRAT